MKKYTILLKPWAKKSVLPILIWFFLVFLYILTPESLIAQEGVVPVNYPDGGFAIDGNLLSRTPTSPPFSADDGDFLPNDSASGNGGNVFTLAGLPIDTATSFHVVDGFDAADAEIFTQGSKFNQDPNDWDWKQGKAPGKDDINNFLFFFASDTLGNIWFIGGGDRNKTNGNTYLDFELFQNPLYSNADGTFTSMGPDGGRTVGDLVISITYTNGGTEPELFIYQWNETNPEEFSYILLDPPAGTTFMATNMDSAVVVPFGAFGEYSYQESAFTEVACNITEMGASDFPCLGIKTVIAKTKASQSINAVLKDIAGPVQVNINSAPVISVDDAIICFGDTATLIVNVLSGSGPYTYLWSTGDTSQSIQVSPDSTTQYSVLVTGINGCPSNPDTATVTVLPLPVCFIDGPDTICPLETAQFDAPDSLSSYFWTVYGPAMIMGDSSMQTVEVEGTGYCDTTFILELVTYFNGCASTCSMTVAMIDTLAPVFSYVPDSMFLQCASTVPAASPDSVTVSDNCVGNIILMVSDSIMSDTLCPNQFTLIRTWTATDTCGNTSLATQYISVFDSIPPELYGVPADTGVCCADSIPLPANVTAIDSCDGVVDVTLIEVVSDSTSPSYFTLTRIWTAWDTCNNMVSDSMEIEVNDTLYPSGGGLLTIPNDEDIVLYYRIMPNPFSDATHIQFSLSRNANVSLELYNTMGIKLKSLYSGYVSAGKDMNIQLSPGASMVPGMYLLVLKTQYGMESRKVILR